MENKRKIKCPKCGQDPKIKNHDFYSTVMCCGTMVVGDTAQEVWKNWVWTRKDRDE